MTVHIISLSLFFSSPFSKTNVTAISGNDAVCYVTLRDLLQPRESELFLSLDVLVWTNEQVIHWAQSIGLREYSGNLLESGVHGALVALDETFDYSSLALILQIPMQNTQVNKIHTRPLLPYSVSVDPDRFMLIYLLWTQCFVCSQHRANV